MTEDFLSPEQEKALFAKHPELAENVKNAKKDQKPLFPQISQIPQIPQKSQKTHFLLKTGYGTFDPTFTSFFGIFINSLFFWPISFIYYSRIWLPAALTAPIAIGGLWWALRDPDKLIYGYLGVGFLSLVPNILAFFIALAEQAPQNKADLANWAQNRSQQVDRYHRP